MKKPVCDPVPSSSSSLKNSSLSLAEWDFFISAFLFRGTFRLRDGEKKEGRFLSGVGGVLKDVTCRETTAVLTRSRMTCGDRTHRHGAERKLSSCDVINPADVLQFLGDWKLWNQFQNIVLWKALMTLSAWQLHRQDDNGSDGGRYSLVFNGSVTAPPTGPTRTQQLLSFCSSVCNRVVFTFTLLAKLQSCKQDVTAMNVNSAHAGWIITLIVN